MSSGGNDWTAEEPNACKHTDFAAMRDIAYDANDIKHVPVRPFTHAFCCEVSVQPVAVAPHTIELDWMYRNEYAFW